MYSEDDESQEGYINYKQKYRELKKHLRALIYENECFQDELRKAQRNFVSISRDKSFLLDRILKYEKPAGLSSDSEITESSDEDEDATRSSQYTTASVFGQRKKITKRKRSDVDGSNGSLSQPMEQNIGHTTAKLTKPISSKPVAMKVAIAVKKPKRPPTARKPPTKKEKTSGELGSSLSMPHLMKSYHMDDMHVVSEEQVHTGSDDYVEGSQRFDFSTDSQVTREEIERHLEARRFSPEIELNTTATVPAELFSQDPDQESDLEGSEICEFVQLEDDGTSADMILE